jgi:hypothetical protein
MKFKHIARGKGPAVDVYRMGHAKPKRFRFHGIVHHKGKLMRQRLGFSGPKKVVEIAYVPIRRKR